MLMTLPSGARTKNLRTPQRLGQVTDEQRRRGGLTRQAQLRSEREERRRRLEAVLDAKLEALADALIAKALQGGVGALREALHQLVGRPTEVVQGTQTARSGSWSSRSRLGGARQWQTWRQARMRSRS
jgi:hypothetical protein